MEEAPHAVPAHCQSAQSTALRNPAQALPPELVCEIFRILDFGNRFAVSHVCAPWRHIALSDGRLWAQYPISGLLLENPRSRIDAKTTALSTMLARSDPLPFRLMCEREVPDSIAETVIAHIGRFRELRLGRFQNDEALLRILAPGCIVPNLRYFTGLLPQDRDITSLSITFPNLRHLSLRGLTESSTGCLEPLPPALTRLQLRTLSDESIDCTDILRSFSRHGLRRLTISRVQSAWCVFEAWRLFERTTQEKWALRIHDNMIILFAPPSEPGAPPVIYDLIPEDPFWLVDAPHVFERCSRLSEAQFGVWELSILASANAVLPQLATAIVLLDRGDYDAVAALQDSAKIQAPALHLVTVCMDAGLAPDQRAAAAIEKIVHVFHAPLRAWVIVHGVSPDALPYEGLVALAGLALRVEARDSNNNVLHVFTSAGEAASTAL